MSDGLLIVPGWDNTDAERFSPHRDEYEEALRLCRKQGHEFSVGFDSATGGEVLVCDRCNAVFVEQDR